MQKGASMLTGTRDFRCFARSGSEVSHYLCSVYTSPWLEEEGVLSGADVERLKAERRQQLAGHPRELEAELRADLHGAGTLAQVVRLPRVLLDGRAEEAGQPVTAGEREARRHLDEAEPAGCRKPPEARDGQQASAVLDEDHGAQHPGAADRVEQRLAARPALELVAVGEAGVGDDLVKANAHAPLPG